MKGLLAQKDVASVEADLETVQKNLDVYREERQNIMSARESGNLDEQASYLAMVANEQFGVYNFHFGGRPRVSRRSGLLHRVISTLQSVRDQMSALEDQGLSSQQNRSNIELIDGQLATYRDELDKIDEARRGTSRDDLVGQLGSAANWAMAQYNENFAGKDRASRDLVLLSRVCDELLDVGRQMRDLRADVESRANEENLVIVLDNLMLYQNEYEEIQKVQG